MLEISFVAKKEFKRIQNAEIDKYKKLKLISDMCRLNALSAVKKAGSGHIGSSFSAMDVFTLAYFSELNTADVGVDNPDRDIFFSSKGHDCPGHYSILAAVGILEYGKICKLRRIDGLDGHPDVKIPGMEINSGSLGMGISKAKGMAYAKNIGNRKGRVFVLTGDGELQEGQIWESLQTTAHQRLNNVHVIVDFNKIQTDKPVKEIIDLGDLKKKFEVFGWYVERCDGHDFTAIDNVFTKFKNIKDKPKALIADTIKGKGISFMEGPLALKDGDGLYHWHSGAPDNDLYERGFIEIQNRIDNYLGELGLEKISIVVKEKKEKGRVALKDIAEKVVNAYSETLVELGEERDDIIVLDADLSADCGLRPFENSFPDRFIENGIAEQDMVSMAGGLALEGYLPIVNSFGVFLASRANEQIYNNATEGTKIIYVCHYAGLIPAGPGKSHQSLRDISLFGALPNCIILEPCNAVETRHALNWCVNEAKENCMVRLAISPSPRSIKLPDDYKARLGTGAVLREGSDAVIFGYGYVLLHEALVASEFLAKEGFSLKVINMPWLNRVDSSWFEEISGNCKAIFVLDNHSPNGGLGDCLLNERSTSGKRFVKLGVESYPACGTPQEALSYHGLDGKSLAERIIGLTV